MKINFIWVKNYKSINERNKLVVHPSVTVVIGKNESGKSNLIDILGSISLLKGLPTDVYNKKTQGQRDSNVEVEVECNFSNEELEYFGIESKNNTSLFKISKQNNPYQVSVSGVIHDYFTDKKIQNNLNFIKKFIDENKNLINSNDVRKNVENSFDNLIKATDYIIHDYDRNLEVILKGLSSLLEKNQIAKLREICSDIREHFLKMYNCFPIFHKYNELSYRVI